MITMHNRSRRTDGRTLWQWRDDSFERTHRAIIKPERLTIQSHQTH